MSDKTYVYNDDDSAMTNMARVYEERRRINHKEGCARYFNSDPTVACDCGATENNHTHLFGMWLNVASEFTDEPNWFAFKFCPECGNEITPSSKSRLVNFNGGVIEYFEDGEIDLGLASRREVIEGLMGETLPNALEEILDDESESSRNFRKDIARIDREYRQTGSFFALKPGEKGKHGTIGGEAK